MSGSDWDAEDNQSFLVSVSDLMSSLIFLFIITLMMFALKFDTATSSLESAGATRAEMLRTMKQRLLEHDAALRVEIDTLQGILRLGEQSINFPSGDASPLPQHRRRVDAVADVLSEVLPCFLPGLRVRCSDSVRSSLDTIRYAAPLEAVLIEGHTDNVPIVGVLRSHYASNMELSGARAARILRLMTEHAPLLDSLRNASGLQVLSISGYGERRLADTVQKASAVNRRIDLRFLMEPPKSGAGAAAGAVAAALHDSL